MYLAFRGFSRIRRPVIKVFWHGIFFVLVVARVMTAKQAKVTHLAMLVFLYRMRTIDDLAV